MSFTWNPYKAAIIVITDSGRVQWLCDSCGGGWRYDWPADTSVAVILEHYHEHVRESHQLTPEDVKDWSAP